VQIQNSQNQPKVLVERKLPTLHDHQIKRRRKLHAMSERRNGTSQTPYDAVRHQRDLEVLSSIGTSKIPTESRCSRKEQRKKNQQSHIISKTVTNIPYTVGELFLLRGAAPV
jgi:hypothetical protein